MVNRMEIGNRIFHARMRKNLKQAVICKSLGISQSAFSDLETGKRPINIEEVYILAETLDVSVTWLIGMDVDKRFTDEEQLKIEEFKQYLLMLHDK